MNTLFILLQDAPAGGFLDYNLIFFIGILVVFYFFLIRPQQKRQKEEKKFREELAKGDKVVTIGGIHGQVLSIEGDTALVRIDENTKVRLEKTALKAPGTPPNTEKS